MAGIKRHASARAAVRVTKRQKEHQISKDQPQESISHTAKQHDDYSLLKPPCHRPSSPQSLEDWLLPEISDGEVYYVPDFISPDRANQWLEGLEDLETWYHPTLKVYGKEVVQSRSIAAYANDPTRAVRYSGHDVQLHYEYPPLLSHIQECVEGFLGETFNHVMLNRYASGIEYIGKHRDTKENKVIASLSLGAERTFIMSPNNSSTKKVQKWVLANGSLLVMKGATQDNWKHEIPREPKIKGVRISLTFRQLR